MEKIKGKMKETIKETIKDTREKIGKKEKIEKVAVMKVGTHRKSVGILWALLILSVRFGIYKNFTAIDVHTVTEKEVINEKLVDTNAVESFVKNFAKTYYTWSNDKDSIEKRASAIGDYLTNDLKALDADTIRSDIPTSSSVEDVQIWEVEQKTYQELNVTYSVMQLIIEGEDKSTCKTFYTVMLYKDTEDNLVIIKTPTICAAVEKSSYQPESISTDGTLSASETKEINDFLNTFFKLYPTAEEKELAYYVKDAALKPVDCNSYVFSKLENPVYTKKDDQVQVSVTVEYLDQQKKVAQISQFDLTLEKEDNWMIVKQN